MINLKKSNNGITLIALVITIIVLLILAGISVSMLTGQNGILNRASEAKEVTEKAVAIEKVKTESLGSLDIYGEFNMDILKENLKNNLSLEDSAIVNNPDGSIKVTVDKCDLIVFENGEVEEFVKLDSTEDTTPFLLPGTEVTNNDLATGFTIKDRNGNEWVWIEVPRSIYTNTTYNDGKAPIGSEDYAKIESVMQKYAEDYRKTGWTDTFYSKDQHGFENSTEYNNWKNVMLKSVYNNGGFYIGRYEAGTFTLRTSEEASLTDAVIQEGAYPYNYVTNRQAQDLSKTLATGGKTSSLMFGIQWDLALKYIEEKNPTFGNTSLTVLQKLKEDSSSWGNYGNVSFPISKGEYSTNDGNSYSPVDDTYPEKPASNVLLTTGATERNSVLNIYDLAGNVWEWTLEYTSVTSVPCSNRGGSYYNSGLDYPSVGRGGNKTYISGYRMGFRTVLF